MLDPKFISVSIAQAESGLSREGWRRFLTATDLPVYRIPGNSKVVEREALDAAIERVREQLPLDEAVTP
jgi:hypothetical protein